MKKILIFLFTLFSIFLNAMEKEEPPISISNNEQPQERQDAFVFLPPEIEEYILNFLLENNLNSKSTIDKILNILSNKNFANLVLVHKQWNDFAKNKIAKLIFIRDWEEKMHLNPVEVSTVNKFIKKLKSLSETRFRVDDSKNFYYRRNLLSEILRKYINNPEIIDLTLKYICNREKKDDCPNFLILAMLKNFKKTIESALKQSRDKTLETLKEGDHYKKFTKRVKCLTYLNIAIVNITIDANCTYQLLVDIFYICVKEPEIIKMIFEYLCNFDEDIQVKFIKEKRYNNNCLTWAKNYEKIIALILNFISKFDLDKQLEILNNQDPEYSVLISSTLPNAVDNFPGIATLALILNHIREFDVKKQVEILNTQGKRGHTVLTRAIYSSNKKAVENILNHISKFDSKTQLEILNAKNKWGQDALYCANNSSGPTKFRKEMKEIYNLIKNKKNTLNLQTPNKTCLVS